MKMFSNSKSMSLHRNPDGFRKSPSNLPAHLGESRIRCQISDFRFQISDFRFQWLLFIPPGLGLKLSSASGDESWIRSGKKTRHMIFCVQYFAHNISKKISHTEYCLNSLKGQHAICGIQKGFGQSCGPHLLQNMDGS